MCYTQKKWHKCGRHTERERVYYSDATINPSTGQYNSCGNPGGTADGGFTHRLCDNTGCAFSSHGGEFNCCRYSTKVATALPTCGCGHECCWDCTQTD